MNKLFPLCYETLGDPQNPCIILIMGIGGQLIHWPTEFTQGLVKKGFYVLLFDNRDTGLSRYYDHLETPNLLEAIAVRQQRKYLTLPYTLEDMAADVIMLMDELSIKQAHIAGISMGGMISQIVALKYPERVLSLTCIATTTGDPNLPPAKPKVLEYFFSFQRQVEDLESYVSSKIELHKIYNHPEHVDEKKTREFFIEAYLRAYNPSGFKRQLLAIIFAESRVEELKSILIPSLIIHGDYDPVFSIEHGKQLAQSLTNSHLGIIEKMGHGLPECLSENIVNLIVKYSNI